MGRFFGMDTKLYRVCSLLWELIVLNLITILTCIPVITAGASLTSMHYVLLKLIRSEEGYTTRMFFKAFRENFKKSTILWIAMLLLFGSFWLDWQVAKGAQANIQKPMQYFVLILAFVCYFLLQYVFPLQSHFENDIFTTVKNSAILAIARFPRTLVMGLVWVIPYEILTHSMVMFPLILMLGVSLPGYVGARMYHPVFKALEPEEEEEIFGELM